MSPKSPLSELEEALTVKFPKPINGSQVKEDLFNYLSEKGYDVGYEVILRG